jgi:hypothetical protein
MNSSALARRPMAARSIVVSSIGKSFTCGGAI